MEKNLFSLYFINNLLILWGPWHLNINRRDIFLVVVLNECDCIFEMLPIVGEQERKMPELVLLIETE